MASEFPKDVGQPPVGGGGMIGRIQRLILKPKDEWPAIDAEPMTVQGIMTSWVLPLAAIGPIASVLRSFLFPITIPIIGTRFYPSLIGSIVQAIVAVILTAVGVWLWSLILDALAPNFKGTKNPIAALKLVAFSATAMWLCGIFQLTWWTMPLMFLGLYSAYIFWVGVPIMMKVPQDQAPVYVIIAIVIGIVVNAVVGMVALGLAGTMFAMTPGAANFGTPGGTITVGGTTLDTGKLTDAATKMEAASKSMEASIKGGDGTVKAVDPTALQNLLPASFSGWNRTSIESQGGGAAGINGSNARAEFQSGDQSFSLSVTDMGALGNLATLGGAVNASSNRQTATGYEKSEMQGGNMVSEKWDTQSKSGRYSVMVASRFAVEANGSAPNIDTLKSAVAAVNLGQLQSMAK
jgi:hypothetical protein